MDIKRNIYQDLKAWKTEQSGTILILEVPTQVGKTYTLKKFGKECFFKMIYINMTELSGQCFLRCIAIQKDKSIKDVLKLYDSKYVDDDETLIIIDDVQELYGLDGYMNLNAESLKSRLIVAGTRIANIGSRGNHLWSKEVTYKVLLPLTLGEFKDVLGDHVDIYKIYQKTGGYPVVVAKYIEEKNLENSHYMLRRLVDIFSNEYRRYFTDIEDANLIQRVFCEIALLMIRDEPCYTEWNVELCRKIYQNEDMNNLEKIKKIIGWLLDGYIIKFVSPKGKLEQSYCFQDVGIAYYFLHKTGSSPEELEEVLAKYYVLN